MTSLRAGSATDTGRTRQINQDDLLVADQLFAVADGMGGHQGGEVASALAIEALREHVGDPTPESLLAGARIANQLIYEKAAVDPDLHGMGTTLCAVALVDGDGDDEIAVINVGDSRVYLFRDETLTQLTRDHSLVEDLREEGRLSDEELAVHPHRNIITRALGIAPRVEIDEYTVVPHRGDRIVLCSDGLFNEVTADRMAATLRRLSEPGEVADELVRQANEGGGRDNITCIVVDVVDDDGRDRAAAEAAPVVRRRRSSEPDLAGFTTAVPAADVDDGDAPRARSGAGRTEGDAKAPRSRPGDDEPRPRRFTWRVAAFFVLLVAVLGGTAAAVAWYARGSYYVGYDGAGQVTVYQGRSDPVLWFHPTVVQDTGIARAQVPAQFDDAVAKGKEWPDRRAADRYIANMRSVICQDVAAHAEPPTTTPPTTAPGTPLPPGAVTTPAPTTVAPTTAVPSATTTTLPPECATPTTTTTTTTSSAPAPTAAPATPAPSVVPAPAP